MQIRNILTFSGGKLSTSNKAKPVIAEYKHHMTEVQKCGRELMPRDQKLGVRERDLRRRRSAFFRRGIDIIKEYSQPYFIYSMLYIRERYSTSFLSVNM